MTFSYDYEELINEIEADIKEGLIKRDDNIQIVRSPEVVYQNYRPIIDYYYDDDIPEEPVEIMSINKVLQEMNEQNNLF